MLPPYIGITGFMSPEEVRQVLEVVPVGARHKLMVGVLASSKTLRGIPNKWPNRYPKSGKISEIFIDHPAVLNLVHFNTEEPEQLLKQMIEVTKVGGPNFHGFQLNIEWPWPNPDILWVYKKRYPGKILVLQAGSSVLEFCEHNPDMLAAAAWFYDNGICDYLLIDPSGGFGKMFDPKKGLEYLKSFNSTTEKGDVLRKMKFGIAGGLGPETLDVIKPIAKTFSDTCIDAEGRLRDADDNLDIDKAKAYAAKAYRMFGSK